MRRRGSWSWSRDVPETTNWNSARGSVTSSLERRLVSEVRARPQLYTGSRCSDLSNRGWQAVADALKLSVFECKRRWRMLLKQFKKEYASGNKSTWPYYDSLLFILPFIKNDRQNSSHSKANGQSEQLMRPHVSPSFNQTFCGRDQAMQSNGEPSAVKQDFSIENSCSKINSFVENAVPPSHENNTSHRSSVDETVHPIKYTDPDEHFLLSLLPTFKRLNEKQNATARIKVSQILYNIEFGVQRKSRQFPQTTPMPSILIRQPYSDDNNAENSDSESIISIHDL